MDTRARGAWFEPPRPRLLAHRGLASDAPENTLLAFLHALALGATYLETDVHASRDGIAVVSHDPDLSRLAGRTERVSDLTLRELQEIRLGNDQTFCSLAEALDAFPEARFNIDIKSEDAVRPTAAAIVEARAQGRVLVTSFSERRRRAVSALLPGVATGASATRVALALVAGKLGLSPVARFALRDIDAVQVPERALGLRMSTPRMLRRLHAAGVEVHFWTINDLADMRRLLDLGADGLVTDRVDIALALVSRGA